MSAWTGVAALCWKPDEPRLLMVLQGMPGQPPTWTLPGGPLKPGESPEDAVRREAREDAGLEVEIARRYRDQAGTAEDVKKRPFEFECAYFEVRAPSARLRPQDPDRLVYRAAWVDPRRLPELGLFFEFQREVIEAFCQEAADAA